jgi:LCP family protein required for cell wall assembly
VESTVYRRGSDGKVIGTPEVKSTSETPDEPIFSVTTYRAGEIGNTQSQPRVVAEKPQSVFSSSPAELQPVVHESEFKTPSPVKSQTPATNPKNVSPKTPTFTLPKFSFRKSRSRYPRPVRYIRNIVLAYLGFYLVLGVHAASSLDKIPASPNVTLADTSGTNWLLVGSDSREGLSKSERRELRTGKDEGSQRTDTIMLINISENGKPTLISLPRDSFVTIPAHIAQDGSSIEDRKNKINTAYGQGGAPLLVETVERNTGLQIDHYMEVGFKGIRDITNAVGGVNMCIPADVTDKNSGLDLLAGCQELDGKDALAYVRMRYADPKGDLGRIERQQQYLSSVLKKVATPAVLINPFRMWNLVDAGTESVNVGDDDSVADVAKLAQAMRGLSNGTGTLMTVPVASADANTAAGSSVIWDEAAARELFISLGASPPE